MYLEFVGNPSIDTLSRGFVVDTKEELLPIGTPFSAEVVAVKNQHDCPREVGEVTFFTNPVDEIRRGDAPTFMPVTEEYVRENYPAFNRPAPKVGQKWRVAKRGSVYQGDEHLLATVGAGKYALVSLENGIHWAGVANTPAEAFGDSLDGFELVVE